MNQKIIFELLEKFSMENEFGYNQNPVPYRPYGEITGIISETKFTFYIYQPEGRISAPVSTVFSLPIVDFIPKGFCIEHGYPSYTGSITGEHVNRTFDKSKSFDEQVAILSYDQKVVSNFLNSEIKQYLMSVFELINTIETTLFKARSCLRISDLGISITIGRVFEGMDSLNKVHRAVIDILLSINNKFIELTR
jgi:hypothetical protein